MNQFKRIRKSIRRRAIEEGIVRTVAERTGFTPATVSRTFAGRFDRPNGKIAAALTQFMEERGIESETAA